MKKRRLLAMFTAVAMVLSFATLFTPASAAGEESFAKTWGYEDEYTYEIDLEINLGGDVRIGADSKATLLVDNARPLTLRSGPRQTLEGGAEWVAPDYIYGQWDTTANTCYCSPSPCVADGLTTAKQVHEAKIVTAQVLGRDGVLDLAEGGTLFTVTNRRGNAVGFTPEVDGFYLNGGAGTKVDGYDEGGIPIAKTAGNEYVVWQGATATQSMPEGTLAIRGKEASGSTPAEPGYTTLSLTVRGKFDTIAGEEKIREALIGTYTEEDIQVAFGVTMVLEGHKQKRRHLQQPFHHHRRADQLC